jgi:hypothetical protein
MFLGRISVLPAFEPPAAPPPESRIVGPLRRRGRRRLRSQTLPALEDPDNGWRKERAERIMERFDRLGESVREVLARSASDIDDRFLSQLPDAYPPDDGRITDIVKARQPAGI